VRLPRNLSGVELARLLHRYGYQITRQTGSHVRLTSTVKGRAHHITVPAHKELKVGTLNAILVSVGAYLEIERRQLLEELFEG
jgi:predicted RNA binding protein YcfA (HicA-like mRNA interferase family)